MTTAQIIKLDDTRGNGRARLDERHSGSHYVIGRSRRKGRPKDDEGRLRERII